MPESHLCLFALLIRNSLDSPLLDGKSLGEPWLGYWGTLCVLSGLN